ncbi:hypothetical protein Tco_1473569 [Tanacetum coccineum]
MNFQLADEFLKRIIDSPFDLEAFSDSDYAGASLDRKSITGGCQFLDVLWIQKQMLDYGFNFMNTKIYIDNESTICIVKNTVFHSKTKHIEIRHHFIRDSYEKKLIQVIKIHTDHNVADLLTKAFDVSSAALYMCIGIADNTHKSFVSGKAIWNYAYKCSGLYIMDAYNGVQELPSDKNRLILVTAT